MNFDFFLSLVVSSVSGGASEVSAYASVVS